MCGCLQQKRTPFGSTSNAADYQDSLEQAKTDIKSLLVLEWIIVPVVGWRWGITTSYPLLFLVWLLITIVEGRDDIVGTPDDDGTTPANGVCGMPKLPALIRSNASNEGDFIERYATEYKIDEVTRDQW